MTFRSLLAKRVPLRWRFFIGPSAEVVSLAGLRPEDLLLKGCCGKGTGGH